MPPLSSLLRRVAPLGALLFGLSLVPSAIAQPASPQSPMDEAGRLESQARALAKANQIREAIAPMERSIAIQEEQVIPTLPAEVQALFRAELTDSKLFLAALLEAVGENGRAAVLLETEIARHEALPSSKHKGDLPEWRTRLQAMRRAAAPPPPVDDPAVEAKTAIGLSRAGRISEALIHLEHALPLLEKAPRPDRTLLAVGHLVAADIDEDASRLGQAEQHYLVSLRFAEQAFGAAAPELLDLLGKLGHHYLGRGDHTRALPFLERAVAIAQPLGHKRHADAMVKLAAARLRGGDGAQADKLLRRALELYQAEPGGELGAAVARFGMAQALDDRARFDEAEALYEPLRRQLKELARKDPSFAPVYATLVGAIGWHHRLSGDTARAEQELLEAIALRGKGAPEDAAKGMTDECNLGEVYWVKGELERALDHIAPCFERRDAAMSQVLVAGSEEQKRAYLAEHLLAFAKTMTAQLRAGNGNPRLNALALTQVFRLKGRILDAMTGSAGALRRSLGSEGLELLDRLATVRTTLAGAATAGGDPGRLATLEEEARTLETRLAEQSKNFRRATAPVDVGAVQRALPAGQALVEIVQFAPLDASYRRVEDAQPVRYLAYVLRSEGEPQAVDLGVASEIDAHVAALRAALASPAGDPSVSARALHDRVMLPLEPLLQGATQLFLSPDGALNAVPFAALMDASGNFLLEKYTFTYLTSGRDLLRQSTAGSDASSPSVVVFADPKFELGGGRPPAPGTAPSLATTAFPPLPGTAAEAKAIQELFPEAEVHTGEAASEAGVKRLAHPGILHLATHGFFLGASRFAVTDSRGFVLGAKEAKKALREEENPLLRSGLVFAGATGLQGGEGEDGILTALEAAGLDLGGTRLVVLSACQTGEGEIRNGEGVYGLRRALVVAGAETLVMSLWSVDDAATGRLMQGYYARLKAGSGRSEGLRESQLELARAQATRHPFYWAAFIPSGDPGRLALSPAPEPGVAVVASPPVTPVTPSASPGFLDSGHWPDLADYGLNLGLSPLTVGSSAGLTLWGSLEVSILSALLDDVGNDGDGVVIYDRLVGSLGVVELAGDRVGAAMLDYSLLLGFRGEGVGFLGGIRLGNGFVVDVATRTSGTFIPLVARLELNLSWFGGSHAAINAWGVPLAGDRHVFGFDARLPLGTPNVWLQLGLQRLGAPPGGPAGAVGTFTIGYGT